MDSVKVKGSELSGRYVDLPDARIVWVGTHPKFPDCTGILFRNAEGEVTSFRLSPEAKAALVLLLTDPGAGVAGPPPPPPLSNSVFSWTLVKQGSAASLGDK